MQRVIKHRRAPVVRSRYRPFKRGMDIAFVLLLAPIVAPLMALCALAIYIESGGPIFFFQQRTGVRGRRFLMFKFRTMVPNAEQLKAELVELNELTWPDFKISDDPRVTRVGRFLRRSSLDELPQLINVLRGEMSLVGPRPTSFSADTYDLWHTERLEAVPGVTGLWQISGRSDVDFDERARLDVEYIENQSLFYDLRILFLTVAAVVSNRGAY
jgi:lipopolysaccharide/colanic/teichoic acid biosynthesis glycosyltransferase